MMGHHDHSEAALSSATWAHTKSELLVERSSAKRIPKVNLRNQAITLKSPDGVFGPELEDECNRDVTSVEVTCYGCRATCPVPRHIRIVRPTKYKRGCATHRGLRPDPLLSRG
jgi:hypothetical protein